MKEKNIFSKKVAVLLFTACIILFNACTSKNTHGAQNPPPFIIDAHVHYQATDTWEKSFLDVYSRFNAMACLLVSEEDVERGIHFAKAHSDRIIPYVRIHLDNPQVLQYIKKVHSMGYKGLGEVAPGNKYNYDDERYDSIWSLAEELNLPLLLHTGVRQTGSFALLRPVYLATIAAKHPKLYIVGAHFGNPWYDEAGESTRRNSNLYFDLSGSSLIKKENDPGIWKTFLWWTPYLGKAHMPKDAVPAFEKIVFSSDQNPEDLEENFRRFNKMLDANDVPDDIRAKMYGLTMAKILGINVPTRNK